jgi:hypothetical protein
MESMNDLKNKLFWLFYYYYILSTTRKKSLRKMSDAETQTAQPVNSFFIEQMAFQA